MTRIQRTIEMSRTTETIEIKMNDVFNCLRKRSIRAKKNNNNIAHPKYVSEINYKQVEI